VTFSQTLRLVLTLRPKKWEAKWRSPIGAIMLNVRDGEQSFLTNIQSKRNNREGNAMTFSFSTSMRLASLLGLIVLVSPVFGDDASESKSAVRGALVRQAVYTRVLGDATAAPAFALQSTTPATSSSNIQLTGYGVRHYGGGGFYHGGGFYGGYRPYYGGYASFRPYYGGYGGYYGYRNYYRPYYAGYGVGFGYPSYYAGYYGRGYYGGNGGYGVGYYGNYGCGNYASYYPTTYYVARPTWYAAPISSCGCSTCGYTSGCSGYNGCASYGYQPSCSCGLNTSYSPYAYGAVTTQSPYSGYTVRPGVAATTVVANYSPEVSAASPPVTSESNAVGKKVLGVSRVREMGASQAKSMHYF
jgi:hypothetical protein